MIKKVILEIVQCHVDEALKYREYEDLNNSLNIKFKLSLYESFCKEIEFNYLQEGRNPETHN